ncbi:MAG: leucyl/phenylalanyl-tRNA--protein transferase [Thermoguttaceae bacterium]|nr:leucyl/phenylalanyl-tRNA--protein transferase [Thermoguttaceae bacterium]MBP3695052.1 leucyl/phenylalanyl-tRNA--protein transferase [Thermoguttaceae bacterium]
MEDSEKLERRSNLIRQYLQWSRFPDPTLSDEDGVLAIGGEIDPDWLLDAYIHGIFPWPCGEPDIPTLWFSPHERALIDPKKFHISRRLRQTLRSGKFTVTLDRAFRQVIEHCAYVPRSYEEGTWITPEIIEGFCAFHEAGFAHSVEVWQDGKLVGGLYGEAIGSYFAGESKFHLERDASKVGLAWLVRHLETLGFTLIDIQVVNSHTEQFRPDIVPQEEFLQRLHRAVQNTKVVFSPEFTWKKEDF